MLAAIRLYSDNNSTRYFPFLLFALDNGNVVGVVFIDFKKPFDCVSHSILDLKLQALGISGPALERIRDYLKDRKQFAIVNGCKSEL